MNSRDKQNPAGRLRPGNRKGAAALPEEQSAVVERFVTIAAIAKLLGVCERTVRRWIGLKELVAHRFGSITRISERDLQAFIGRMRRGPPAPHSCDPVTDEFYTAQQIAELLGVCIRTVRRRLKSKVLVGHSFGGMIRIARTDLQDFVSRSRED